MTGRKSVLDVELVSKFLLVSRNLGWLVSSMSLLCVVG